jgi:hypothetical protein
MPIFSILSSQENRRIYLFSYSNELTIKGVSCVLVNSRDESIFIFHVVIRTSFIFIIFRSITTATSLCL